jgi:hypothetical protein
MATILQIDSVSLSLFFTAIGLLVGFFAGSVTNMVKDYFERRRLRGALYSEITLMLDALRTQSAQLKKMEQLKIANDPKAIPKEGLDVLTRAWIFLQNELRGDTYRYAKNVPVLSHGIKDIKEIDKIYYVFSFFNIECDRRGIDPLNCKEEDIWAQILLLRIICDSIGELIAGGLAAGDLDKKLLLKESDAAPTARRFWKKLLEERPAETE